MPVPKIAYTAEDYWNLPEGRRAELIKGELWDMAAPSRVHQEIVHLLDMRLGNYIAERGGRCRVYPAPFAVDLFADDSTIVEPDVSVVCDRDKLSPRGCVGAPDFVVEVVSPSTAERDYVDKTSLYRQAGVREYWICDPQQGRILAYRFGTDEIVGIYPLRGTIESLVFPGFSIDLSEALEEG